MIVTPPDKPIKFPEDAEIQFSLSSDVLTSVLKAINVLQSPEFSVTGLNGKVYVGAVNTKNPNGDTFNIEVGAGLGPLKGKIWRIGLMGETSNLTNVCACLSALGRILNDAGRAVDVEAALAAVGRNN